MQITITDFDPDTRTVAVTFEHDGVTHIRSVNACFDAGGDYDAAATADRVGQVGLGVVVKIAAGLIVNPSAAEDVDPPAGEDSSKD